MITYRPGTPGADLTAYLIRYPREISTVDEDAAVVFDRYHTGDFVLRNDDLTLDRERLLAHARPARRTRCRCGSRCTTRWCRPTGSPPGTP